MLKMLMIATDTSGLQQYFTVTIRIATDDYE